MHRVPYDGRIRQMHSLIVSVPRTVFPSCLPGHSFSFVVQECISKPKWKGKFVKPINSAYKRER